MRIAEKIKMGHTRRISRLNATDVVKLLHGAGRFNIFGPDHDPKNNYVARRIRTGKTAKDHKSGSWASRFARRAADPYRNGSGDYKKIV